VEQIEIYQNVSKQRFETKVGDTLAVLDYQWEDGNMALTHTYVPVEGRGKGLAAALAKFALEYIKENRIKAIVYCPYVAKYLLEHPEYQKLVKK
jgi:predicted GNAT family acetyltransferase